MAGKWWSGWAGSSDASAPIAPIEVECRGFPKLHDEPVLTAQDGVHIHRAWDLSSNEQQHALDGFGLSDPDELVAASRVAEALAAARGSKAWLPAAAAPAAALDLRGAYRVAAALASWQHTEHLGRLHGWKCGATNAAAQASLVGPGASRIPV